MENVNDAPVEQPENASGVEAANETEQQDLVKYESYKKVLSEAKNAKERARQLEAELEAKKNAELEAKGNYQEIIENFKQRLKNTEAELLNTKKQALWKDVTGAIKSEAQKEGCINPDKLIKLIDKDDFAALQSEDGQIMSESVRGVIEKAKRENDFLFKQAAVKVNDVTPSNKVETETKRNMNNLSPAERLAIMKEGLSQVVKA
jgi:hypothetical protein